jgi:RNA polymerase sigma factor (sigma-70 family)
LSAISSVTLWIHQLQTGDQAAVQKLWEGYFRRLVGLARKRLRNAPRRAVDEEDVALSAFKSFYLRAKDGRFPQLLDRDDLWQLLVLITKRKADDLIERECRQKRGGGKVQPVEDNLFANLFGRDPDPAFVAQFAEELPRLLDQLGDAKLRRVAVAKMEGYTNEEIAVQLDCSVATVERKLKRIRDIWGEELTR